MNQNLLVTVFADASVKGSSIGCGCWFKSQQGSATHSTRITKEGINSTEAELWGIYEAIMFVRGHHTGRIDLVVQCDNISALAALMHKGHRFAKSSKLKAPARNKFTPFEQSLLDRISNISDIGYIWLKHVKGHSKGCSRTHINNITDRLAGKASANHQA